MIRARVVGADTTTAPDVRGDRHNRWHFHAVRNQYTTLRVGNAEALAGAMLAEYNNDTCGRTSVRRRALIP